VPDLLDCIEAGIVGVGVGGLGVGVGDIGVGVIVGLGDGVGVEFGPGVGVGNGVAVGTTTHILHCVCKGNHFPSVPHFQLYPVQLESPLPQTT